MKNAIYTTLILAALGGFLYAYSLYNKAHRDVAQTDAVGHFTAAELFEIFDSQEKSSMRSYSDQVVEVEGIIASIELDNAKEPQVVLIGNGDNGFIRCGFNIDEVETVALLKPGERISVKGECKGINKIEGLDLLSDVDVVLSNSVIIEK